VLVVQQQGRGGGEFLCLHFYEFNDPDAGKSERVMEAVLQMAKLDIKTLKKAHQKQPSPGNHA
jgi:hypothetical protein